LTRKSKFTKRSDRSQPQDPPLAGTQAIPATLRALNGEIQPLDVITPLFDAASALSEVTPRIIATAKASAIARFNWKDRGHASIGYTTGMAVAYAAAFARLQAQDPVADRMSRTLGPVLRDSHGRLTKGDALTWYDEQLRAIGLGSATSLERLRRLFVLLLGLGMRESSGRFCEGRDRVRTTRVPTGQRRAYSR
jgi:hypothetical protein